MQKIKFTIKHFMPAAILLAVFAVFADPAAANYLTISEIEECVQGLDALQVCEDKAVLGVAVSHGNEAILDAVTITDVVDQGGNPVQIEDATRITMNKTPPVYNFPLKYFHTVSYFPYEEVKRISNAIPGVQSCIDKSSAANPSCGWTYQGDTKIADSQGFCSNKDLEIVTAADWYRGEEILGEPATPSDPPPGEQSTSGNSFSTAHCLRMGDPEGGLYFHGYEIGSPVVNYQVGIVIEYGANTHAIVLSPKVPLYSSKDDNSFPAGMFHVNAELAGEINFGPTNPGLPELDNYILYIPTSPASHPYVQNYQNNMLLVPREEVSRDGGELDKVGVSFYSFRNLNGEVRVTKAGDGLHNQLFHKHNHDIQEMAKSNTYDADFLVHGKKAFQGEMEFEQGMETILKYKDTSISNSLVKLVMDRPDKVKVVETESIGTFTAYALTFTAISNEGTMIVDVANDVSGRRADFIVTVTECSANILDAIPAQAVTLGAGEAVDLRFNIHTKENLAAMHECRVSLKSPAGKVYQSKLIPFDTKMHGSKFSWDLREENEGAQVGDEN